MLVLDANNPFLNVSNFHLLDLIAACAMIITSGYYSHKIMKRDMRKENKEALDNKASKGSIDKLETYVDKQDRSLHHRINKIEKDTNSLVEKIDTNQNFLIERIENLNNNVMDVLKNQK